MLQTNINTPRSAALLPIRRTASPKPNTDAAIFAEIEHLHAAVAAAQELAARKKKAKELFGEDFQFSPHILPAEFSQEWQDRDIPLAIYRAEEIAQEVAKARRVLVQKRKAAATKVMRATFEMRMDALPRAQKAMEAAFRAAVAMHSKHCKATGYSFDRLNAANDSVGKSLEKLSKMKPKTVAGAAALVELVHCYTKNGDGPASGFFLENLESAPILAKALAYLREVSA